MCDGDIFSFVRSRTGNIAFVDLAEALDTVNRRYHWVSSHNNMFQTNFLQEGRLKVYW